VAQHNEKPFETEICKHLADGGYFYSDQSSGYDKARALFPEDVLGWLGETQPDELAKVVKAGSANEAKQREQLLDRLVKVLDTPMDAGGGTLNVLRNGFKHVSARFDMCQFKPETTLNPATIERYGKVRVRVVRQVYFSTADGRSVDLVLFINGLPFGTLELKTDFTQSVQEAIDQYKKDRHPKHPVTKHEEPLLGFGNRALVHFAVSNDEVWMTTRLNGEQTHFLPFNLGRDGGAGNPLNVSGSPTSYLWERVLQRDSLLDIAGKFMHVEVAQRRDPITGKVTRSTTLLFPRLHQWGVVHALADAARAEGPGHRYLVQHSAGSGKTNSIAWTAHRLARLHNAANEKVFDSVIVVTDRTVLDAQLQEAIRQIDGNTGVVLAVDRDEAARAGATSKSDLLAKALTDGKLIIVVTIQTFPFALDAIRKTKGLKDKTFAVIADEAHSSQTGATANKLKEVLSAEELSDLEDGGEIDTEALLAAEMTARAASENISYFAFTATPKSKTLELFGTPDGDGKPRPFHLYTMKQAIEEGYILDVLPGYHDFDTAFQIAKNASSGKLKPAGPGEEVQADDKLVDQAAATKGLMRWVKLHPTNIGQKVQIIVEHFRVNVEYLLDGHAKAMVVTDSRKAAVRYKHAIDEYIAKKGYSEIGTLVAFSGDVEDTETGPGPFNEKTMNPGLNGRDLRTAFATEDFKVMLVANKFQTGFDQPLLVAMYVDKQLSGVTAVQTLSRLNRTYRAPSGEVKQDTFVLDFVNKPEEIKAAFEPYYTDAFLETATDPNLVHDLAAKLDQAAIYTDGEIDAAVTAWIKGTGNNALKAALGPAQQRFKDRYVAALQSADKAELDALDVFRKDVGSFIRLYDFMSQIIDYGDTNLEKRSIYLRLLERLIRPETYTAEVDLSGVVLTNVKQVDKGKTDISLGARTGLKGATAAGSATKRDPKLVAFQEIIERLNELFGDEDFTTALKESFLETLLRALLDDNTLVTQAQANSKTQFLESPDLNDAVVGAVLSNQTSHNKMAEYFFGEGKGPAELVHMIGALVHLHAHVDDDQAA
jgi:type I restriction enzyme R subunit